MTSPLWAAIASRYEQPRRLRAGALAVEFQARFDEGSLVVAKANGVERRIGLDEVRAFYRAVDDAAPPEMLRLITPNAIYLAAVRDDLALPPSDLSEEADDEGQIERELLLEVTERLSRAAMDPSEPSEPRETVVDASLVARLSEQLSSEVADKEGLVRELAGLRAALAEAENRATASTDRAEALEVALKAAKTPATASRIGTLSDLNQQLGEAARLLVAEGSRPLSDLEEAALLAVELLSRDSGAAVGRCRVVLDELVQRQWLTTFAADELPPFRSFGDLARELDGQRGIDTGALSIARSLYRICNPGMHRLGAVGPRRAALVVLAVASLSRPGSLAARSS